ncbi:MAG: hypothetical protein K2G99_05030, partial [Desulfovibrio sp.]|nr:hypothetical protein [Desulfovibrio sp.]
MTSESLMAPGAKLLIMVVRHGAGDRAVRVVRGAGARGGTILPGRGCAASRLLQLLCLADTEKDLVFVLAPGADMAAMVGAVRTSPELCRKSPGIGIVLDVSAVVRSAWQGAAPGAGAAFFAKTAHPGGAAMDQEAGQKPAGHELIFAIVNAGYADDLMAAARGAGAGGGTILKARGTATEADASFFGITIVPEKEVLLVLAPHEAAPAIFEAVRTAPCLTEPGSGIIFSVPAEDFFP